MSNDGADSTVRIVCSSPRPVIGRAHQGPVRSHEAPARTGRGSWKVSSGGGSRTASTSTWLLWDQAAKDDPRLAASLGSDYLNSRGIHAVGSVSTNGIESIWALVKRACYGCYHSMSKKHLHRYVDEVIGRHNLRCQNMGTLDMMRAIIIGWIGQTMTCRELVA